MKRKLYDSQDKDDIIRFIRKDLLNARKINPRWYSDKDVAMHMVSIWGAHLDLLPKEFKSDREIVRLACLKSPSALRYASKELRNDPQMREFAFKRAGHCFIVDPLALMVFSTYDTMLMKETGKNEEKTKAHPFYQRFKPLYDGSASYAEIEEYEKFLLKNKQVFLIRISNKKRDLTKLTDEELDQVDFTKF